MVALTVNTLQTPKYLKTSNFVKFVSVKSQSPANYLFVTVHEKTMHNALKEIFELRPPLPTTTFELLLQQI